jgi:hypothetical protein
VGPTRATGRVRGDPGRRAHQQPRQPHGVHRGTTAFLDRVLPPVADAAQPPAEERAGAGS